MDAGFAVIRDAWLERAARSASRSRSIRDGAVVGHVSGSRAQTGALSPTSTGSSQHSATAMSRSLAGCSRKDGDCNERNATRPARGSGQGQSDELVFMALGGLGEIGMNVYLYGFGPPDGRGNG